MELITQAAYARRKGVTRPYIGKLVKKGVIVLDGGKVDPDQADKAIEESSSSARTKHKKNGNGKATKTGQGFAQSQAAKEFYRALLAKQEYEKKSGKLIDADDTIRHFAAIFTVVKTKVRAIAPVCTQEIVHLKMGKKNQRELAAAVEKIISTLCDEALEELSTCKSPK